MLTLTRSQGERVIISDQSGAVRGSITVVRSGSKVRLGCEGDLLFDREEVYKNIQSRGRRTERLVQKMLPFPEEGD